jgi:hypothetical protein
MPKKKTLIKTAGKTRRGNKFSRKTCSVIVGDLVYQNYLVDRSQEYGIVLETYRREDEWFATVHWSSDKVTDIYALYLVVVSAIDE